MYKSSYLKALFLIAFFVLSFSALPADAGVISDARMWVSEQANIRQHSRVIAAEVKTLYRERKSVQRFAEGASGLVRAYQSIKNKNLRADFPKLLDIAKSISLVLSEYKNLAPKAEKMYRQAQPSMQYFSQLADKTETIQTAKKRIVVKTFSEGRLESLAGANGWNRVWDTVKENPINIFRWGRLSDEYKLGKIEGQYPLKCAQIAFEATGYFVAARESVQDLLGIQKEIEGIIGGNLNAILNAGSTINKIQNAGSSVEGLGDLAQRSARHMNTRLDELVKIQDQYVAANKSYNEKYAKNQSAERPISTNSTYTPNASANTPITTAAPATTGSNVNLQKAMAEYQKAYEAYLAITGNSNASQQQVKKAAEDLQKAKQQVERAKTQNR